MIIKYKIMDFKDLDSSKNSAGLVPAIIQDARNFQVLMLGYMNEEAFDKTVSTGLVTFYSRDRGCLWTKGETSGNFLHLVSMEADCDGDTLLVKAVPDGPVCHLGTRTCWKGSPESEGFIRELESVIKDRHEKMPEGSYTTSLFREGVNRMAQKVGEEAVETVIEAMAGNRDRLIYESSDLIYHLLVLLTSQGLSIADLEKELLSRHRQ